MAISDPFDRNLVLGFSSLAVLAILVGGWGYTWQRSELQADAQKELRWIAESKAEWIADWRREQEAVAGELLENPPVVAGLRRALRSGSLAHESELRRYFEALKAHHGYSNILLVSPAARVAYADHPTFDHLLGPTLELFDAAQGRRRPMLGDLVAHPGNALPHLHLLIPVFNPAPGREFLGALVFVIEARQRLYPRLQTWPVPSQTGETLLVRREGSFVLFLNDPRFKSGTALTLRIPVNQTTLPAAMAVQGRSGIVRGLDYRGVPVFAALAQVPGTGWSVVAKMDAAEVLANLRWRLGLILGLAVTALAAILILGAWLHQQNRNQHLKLRLSEESKRLALISHFEYLVKYANDLILLADSDRRLVEANDRALAAYGLPRERLSDHFLTEFQSLAEQQDQEALWANTQPGAVLYETTRPGRGGMPLDLEISARVVILGGGRYYQEIARDVTEKRQADAARRESEKKYSQLYETMRDAFVAVNMDGRLIECNRAYQGMLGYSLQELRTKTYVELTPKTWWAAEQKLVEEQILVRGYSDVYEKEYIRKDGTVIPVELRASLLRNPDGTPAAMWAIVRDLTERKRAEEQLRRHGRAQEVLAAAITELVGAQDEEAICESVGRHARDLLPGSFVAVSLSDPDGRVLRIRALLGFERFLGDLRRAIGFDLRQKEFPMEEFGAQELKEYASGKMVRHPEGIYAMLQKKVPQAVCRIIEKILGIRSVYTIGFSWGGRHYGGVILMLPHESLAADTAVLETLVHQASLAIQRSRVEQALRSSEEKFRLISENAADLIWILDLASYKYLYVSPSVLRLRGFTPEEVMAGRVDDSLTPEYAQIVRERLSNRVEAFQAGDESARVWSSEVDQPRKDGTLVRMEVVTTLLTDAAGRVNRVVGVSRDVTAQKKAEEEIRALNADLERRVRERTTELEAANAELESFAYSVSHDLRAPLRSIGGFSQALAEDARGTLTPAAQDHLKKILDAVRKMGQIIEDLLRLSRIQRVELNAEPVDLSALARQLLQTLHEASPDRQVEDAVAPGLTAVADPGLMRILMENLLTNAWKFTGKRERARIEFGAWSNGDGTTYFVKDDGAGFNPEYAGKLFGVFQRLHSLAEFPGTGIGLATAQRILRRHGGRIWAEGAEERGATFYFTLPRPEKREAENGEAQDHLAG